MIQSLLEKINKDGNAQNLACATIPAQSSISLGYIFGGVLDLGFSTQSAVQRGGYSAQARVRHHFLKHLEKYVFSVEVKNSLIVW